MQEIYDIYEICTEILTFLSIEIERRPDCHKKMHDFLITENHPLDQIFSNCRYVNLEKKDYMKYKKVMRLIIVTDYYLNEIHDYEKGIVSQIDEIFDFDEIDYIDVNKLFEDAETADEDELSDVSIIIESFFQRISNDFMKYSDSIDIALSKGYVKNIIRINPFFSLVYLNNYVPVDKLQRIIKDFLDLTNITRFLISQKNEYSIYETYEEIPLKLKKKRDFEYHNIFIEEMHKFYHNNNDNIMSSILYIISFVYEKSALCNLESKERKVNVQFMEYVEELAIDNKQLITIFYTNKNFFHTLIDLFIVYTDNFISESLYDTYNELQSIGDVKTFGVLKRCNPFLDVEKKIYKEKGLI